MKEAWGNITPEGYQYYVSWGIAWIPMYCQGSLIWLSRYWKTWPEKNGRPVMASDVLSKKDMADMNNQNSQMYVVYYPYDPRGILK